jgi:hypothetical protein
MKKAALMAALAIVSFALMGCPSVKIPTGVTANPVGSKVGTSSGKIILGIIGDANAGVYEAAQAGGITKISTVDTEVKGFIGTVVITVTTTVTGE